jgi:hypothetical protein
MAALGQVAGVCRDLLSQGTGKSSTVEDLGWHYVRGRKP